VPERAVDRDELPIVKTLRGVDGRDDRGDATFAPLMLAFMLRTGSQYVGGIVGLGRALLRDDRPPLGRHGPRPRGRWRARGVRHSVTPPRHDELCARDRTRVRREKWIPELR
jgi:hypothetical protein